MKTIVLFFSALFFMATSNAQTADVSTESVPDITKIVSFKELDHDFGKIPYGKPAEFELEMTNISSDTLRLQDVKAGCGCTTPKWQPGPYKAGETFKVVIGFNGYTEGNFSKVVTLFFPGGLTQVVKFHGETFKAPADPAPGNAAANNLKDGK